MISNDDENEKRRSAHAVELTALSSRDTVAGRSRRYAMTRCLLPLGLVTALASTGCLEGTTPGDSEPHLGDGKTATAELALDDTLASRVQIITGATDEREGWGRGATGGASGTIYHVTNLQDAGSGSLRQALEAPGPQWIVFDVSGAIALQSSIQVASDKTVDARGKQIVIKGADLRTTAFRIVNQHNVILINLEFDDDWPDFTMDSEGADAVNIVNSHDIWIHHCEFLQWSDGAIDMKQADGGMNHNVSVTWSRFRKIFQAMLWEGDKLSLGHSVCAGQVHARCPKIIFGMEHSYNNYTADWGAAAIQHAKSGGQLYSELNMFEAGTTTNEVNMREDPTTDKIENDRNFAFNNVAFQGGNDVVDSAFKTQSNSLARIDVCSTPSCWIALKNRLLNGDSVHAAAGNSL